MPNVPISELMTPDPACCTPQTPIPEVARLMVRHDCGAIPVVENESTRRLLGIITDRDIVCRLVAKDIPVEQATAEQAMTDEVATLTQDATLNDCVHLMSCEKVRRVPVVDGNGRVLGIVAQADLARAGADEPQLEEELTDAVEEISEPGPSTCSR